MAKCILCNSRKGKRACPANNASVCSQCCGQFRNETVCSGCTVFGDASVIRNYRKVPYHEIGSMESSMELQMISNVLESALSMFAQRWDPEFNDKAAAQLLELVFDRYHFKDEVQSIDNTLLKESFEETVQILENEFSDTLQEEVIKVLGTIYRSIQRRTQGGKEYLRFIGDYVGTRVAPGVSLTRLPGKFES